MPWTGSNYVRSDGTFTGSTVWAQNQAAGVKVVKDRHDNHDQDIAAGISACINKNGANAVAADIDWGGRKIITYGSVSAPSARTDVPAVGTVQDGAILWGGTAGGTANALTITLSPAITSYAIGLTVRFIVNATNTAAVSLNINGVGAASIAKLGNLNLAPGELVVGRVVEVCYNGTNFRLISQSNSLFLGELYAIGATGTLGATTPLTGGDFASPGIYLPHGCVVTAITIASTVVLTGGSLTVTLSKNGVSTGKTASITSGNQYVTTYITPEVYEGPPSGITAGLSYTTTSLGPTGNYIFGLWGQ